MVAIATFQSLLLDCPDLIQQAAEEVFRVVHLILTQKCAMSERLFNIKLRRSFLHVIDYDGYKTQEQERN